MPRLLTDLAKRRARYAGTPEASSDFDKVKDSLPPPLTPDELLMAVIERGDSEVARQALVMGAKADMGGGAPLVAAAIRQDIGIAAMLVAAGANISQSVQLAYKKLEDFNWGDDPVKFDFERGLLFYKNAARWLRENRQEITEGAVALLASRVARLEGVERQLAELKEAVDAIINPKAIDKTKLSIPKTNIEP